MTQERLLIVDDEQDMLDGLKRVLGYDLPGLAVETCADPVKAVELAKRIDPDLVLLDVRMPGMDGLEALSVLRRDDPLLTVVMMTAHGTIELAVEAMKAGAYDFITKPFDNAALIRTLTKGLERNRLLRENRALRGRVPENDFHGMIGQSEPMRRLFHGIRSVARSDYSVLILGESGTGKELAARALHAESRRRRRAIVTVNCPAIPEHLLESELFGHRRGAFTGAERDQRGLFEEADGGTLFLDEIGDIPVTIQTKLLRALQSGEIKKLGDVKPTTVNVRIIAATNQNLEEKIRDRSFREDLYYRLNVVTLRTPGLADAVSDIPLLVDAFAKTASRELELPLRRFSREALEMLADRPWPGNVRQLQNVVRQAVMFSSSGIVGASDLRRLDGLSVMPSGPDLAPANGDIVPYKEAKDRLIERFTKDYVEDLLKHTGGNVTRSAELSGLGRPSLQKIMRRLSIQSEDYRGRQAHGVDASDR